MGDNIARQARESLPFMLITLVVGILLGLLLGWQVWPVTWYDTDPSDLRAEHQADYVLMTADSLAQTGNAGLARARLGQLQDEDTTWEQVANLVERVAVERENAGDAGSAVLVRRMAQTLQMPPASAAQFQEPQARIRFSDRPLLVPIVAVLLAALVTMALWQIYTRSVRGSVAASPPARTTPAPEARYQPMATVSRPSMTRPAMATSPVYPPVPAAQTWQEAAQDEDEEEEQEERLEAQPTILASDISAEEEEADATGPAIPTTIPGELPEEEMIELVDLDDEDLEEVDEEEEQTIYPAAAQPEAAASELPPDALGLWEADYTYGIDDFDCNFTIETPDQEFLGECGVGAVNFEAGEGPQKVDAFEIWLFDKGDIRTVRQILVSEYAYNDAALSAKLAEKGDVIMAQPGTIITLETLSLMVTATIQGFAYLQDEEKGNAYFERLRVEMVAERNDQLP